MVHVCLSDMKCMSHSYSEFMKVEKLAVKQPSICLSSMHFKLNSQEVSWWTVVTEVICIVSRQTYHATIHFFSVFVLFSIYFYVLFLPHIPGAKTIKKNTNSTQNKSQTHRAKQYKVTSFLSTDCELSTETCSKNVYSHGPWEFAFW